MTLTDPALALDALPDSLFLIECVEVCDSTNASLLARAAEGAPSALVLVADRQTAGRGRRGREWMSTPEGSLTFSVLWRLSPTRMGGLSLAIGLALLYALEKLGARHLALKWPNDLLFLPPNAATGATPGKLAGILVELASGHEKTEMAVVIGMGLNLSLPQGFTTSAAGLDNSLAIMPSRERLLAEILVETRRVLAVLEEQGFAALRAEWQARHAHQNCPVVLQDAGRIEAEGICRGVDEEGALLLEIPGKPGLSRFFAGDLSLRPKQEEKA
ncbi:MAG: biotin--[acetyl-CoA-carboxylase] ligase [Zoogloeaceae bacterium]|jgi:BirA family biotin operon repressor/biotin-[acetyl-CoA-carboxylase] ligase|nr:biotin--[acetyl-CoA-carboxylase] ligase [Zoogloeaceae bacterium]